VLEPGVAGIAEPGVEAVSNDFGAGPGWDDFDPLEAPSLLHTDNLSFAFLANVVRAAADLASDDNDEASSKGGGNDGPTLAAGVYSITGGGYVSNLMCGTGTANGTAVLRGTAPGDTTVINSTFGLTFAASVGQLSLVITPGGHVRPALRGPMPDNNGGTPTHDDAVDGGQGWGVSHIAPSVGNCDNANVRTFTVDGAFEATLSDGSETTPVPAPAGATRDLRPSRGGRSSIERSESRWGIWTISSVVMPDKYIGPSLAGGASQWEGA
jgi:hypothetical protein